MIKYIYEMDYPLGQKRSYLEWVRAIAETLQAPGELRRLVSYDNIFSATPNRLVEFTFDSLADAGKYFDRKEIGLIFQHELPAHANNIKVRVVALRGDYSKDTMVAERQPAYLEHGPAHKEPESAYQEQL